MREIDQPRRAESAKDDTQNRVLQKFLDLSARTDIGGRAIERHLLMSLAIALHSSRPQPQ